MFLHLGIEREVLDECLKENPFDYHSSLVKILAVWLQRENPPPSWQALVDVLQNRLLEGKLAVTIKQKFCPELLVESDGKCLYMYVCNSSMLLEHVEQLGIEHIHKYFVHLISEKPVS